MSISIHASAKEATCYKLLSGYTHKISIHASAKEATFIFWFYHTINTDFNPRLREGGDLSCCRSVSSVSTFQSTPPRRRRLLRWFWRNDWQWFQSTPPRRRRLLPTQKLPLLPEFQSTPPRRRRRHAADLFHRYLHFNPRLREGGDYELTCTYNSYIFQSTPPRRRRHSAKWNKEKECIISIHASAKEATSSLKHNVAYFHYFNPRLREGGDVHFVWMCSGRPISIHASAKEATDNEDEQAERYRISIHASAKEATVQNLLFVAGFKRISIHASAKEATPFLFNLLGFTI